MKPVDWVTCHWHRSNTFQWTSMGHLSSEDFFLGVTFLSLIWRSQNKVQSYLGICLMRSQGHARNCLLHVQVLQHDKQMMRTENISGHITLFSSYVIDRPATTRIFQVMSPYWKGSTLPKHPPIVPSMKMSLSHASVSTQVWHGGGWGWEVVNLTISQVLVFPLMSSFSLVHLLDCALFLPSKLSESMCWRAFLVWWFGLCTFAHLHSLANSHLESNAEDKGRFPSLWITGSGMEGPNPLSPTKGDHVQGRGSSPSFCLTQRLGCLRW